MHFIESNPLPKVCQECEDRKTCLAKGEGEWCCDKCDYLGERFVMVPNGTGNENRLQASVEAAACPARPLRRHLHGLLLQPRYEADRRHRTVADQALRPDREGPAFVKTQSNIRRKPGGRVPGFLFERFMNFQKIIQNIANFLLHLRGVCAIIATSVSTLIKRVLTTMIVLSF